MRAVTWSPPESQWKNHARNRGPFVDKFIPKNSVGAELGVYCGHFTKVLLDIAKPEKLFLVDLWDLHGESWEDWGIKGPSTRAALHDLLKRYCWEIAADRIAVCAADDLVWLTRFPDNYFDWVYIDTSHTYEHCIAELPIVAAKVKPDGIITGDDWESDPNHPHHGVFLAVTEFVEREPYDLVYAADNGDGQWAIKSR